jgi:hypothetical protein
MIAFFLFHKSRESMTNAFGASYIVNPVISRFSTMRSRLLCCVLVGVVGCLWRFVEMARQPLCKPQRFADVDPSTLFKGTKKAFFTEGKAKASHFT